MSKTTNLELFKHDNVTTNTDAFNVEKALNENWDKIDTAVGENNSDIASIKTKNTDQDTRLTNIETKNATQDTNISALQEDVEEMQENIQSNIDEIEDLKEETERLRNDISSISITEEAEGEDITLTETSDARFSKFEIQGNDYQETREGYNLIKISSSSVSNGITFTANGDGSYSISGTATNDISKTLIDLSGKTGNYTYKCIGLPNDCYTDIYYTGNVYGEEVKSFSYTDTSVSKILSLKILANTTVNAKIYPFLVEGTYTNDTLPVYEQYGAMPSLSYKSEIKTIKNSANIAVCNKNLLKITSTTKTVTKNGVTITIDDDGLITINGTCTASWWPDLTYNIANNTVVHEEPKYYIPECENLILSSKYISGSVSPNFFVSCWYSNNEGSNTSLTLINDSVSKSSELTVNTINRVYLTINEGRVFNNYKFYLQLEESSTATDYVVPNEQLFAIPAQQEMLTGDGFVKVDGVWKELHNWNKKTFDGTESFSSSGITNVYYLASIQDYKISDKNICYSNYFKSANNVNSAGTMANRGDGTVAFINSYTNYRFYVNTSEYSNSSDLKAKLAELYNSGNPMLLYYKLETPTMIECTNQQKQKLDELEKTIHTYKEKTHVYSTDELSPIFSVEAIKDTNTVISNIQSMLLEN